ncbi:alpha,alpha-trehalase TreF [Candidatus Saccharibacteria bacterium]|nr:alpha,alpha-trehalase TreF [Candidatus Saccharibacteria bacterium]
MFRRLFGKKPKLDKVKTAIVATAGVAARASKSPDDAYGELFEKVQHERLYPDGKTFVDLIPRSQSRELRKQYLRQKSDPSFNLNDFVNNNFYEYHISRHDEVYVPGPETTTREHISALWPELTKRNRKTRGSLLPLPYAYVVPGGRFAEQFYWDSYFIMLGLAADGQWLLISGMVKNYAYMLRKFGLIPTANRSYFLSRSQPPFFSQMIKLLAKHRGRTRTYAEYLPSLLTEYRFWMKGRKVTGDHPDRPAYARVVRMPNGTVLNRYYDNRTTPRPESRREDVETALTAKSADKDKIFLDLRAGAESGWDFSSRWFKDNATIQSIHTTDMVAVDLNCLLYLHEQTIAEAYTLIKQPLLAKRFRNLAQKRADAIRKYCWDSSKDFFCDYDFRSGVTTSKVTLAGVYPLYAKIATSEQAAAVAEQLEKKFLCEGGLVTTLVHNGQQWDSPNGWAPLQWIAIQGLREYGYHALANEIRDKWLDSCERVFADTRKMIEKYNVVRAGDLGSGGEYPLQDGFGWTNGVYAALKDENGAS